DRGAEHFDRHRRRGQRAARRPAGADAGRHAAGGRFRESRRPAGPWREPAARVRCERPGAGRLAGPRRPRHAAAGLAREFERQRRRGARQHDRDAARLRDELEGDPDRGPDARVREQPAVIRAAARSRRLQAACAVLALAGCRSVPEPEAADWTTAVDAGTAAAAPASRGAIYQRTYYAPLFENPTARRRSEERRVG